MKLSQKYKNTTVQGLETIGTHLDFAQQTHHLHQLLCVTLFHWGANLLVRLYYERLQVVQAAVGFSVSNTFFNNYVKM